MTEFFGVKSAADCRLAQDMLNWIGKEVGCVFGRREAIKGRYCIAIVGDCDEFESANRFFINALKEGRVSSCLYVYREAEDSKKLESVADATRLLRHVLLARRETGARNGNYTQSIELDCPATRAKVEFPDFDFVGFYPQARFESDPLYDPSNYAPVVCINQASDLFGYSLFVQEIMEKKRLGKTLTELDPGQLHDLTTHTQNAWNQLAARTIEYFGKQTNPALLAPARLSSNQCYYVTPHDEAAFGEDIKQPHVSEMPCVYLERIKEEWSRFVSGSGCPYLRHVVRPSICLEDVGFTQGR